MGEDKGSGNSDTLPLCDPVEVTVALWAPISLSVPDGIGLPLQDRCP